MQDRAQLREKALKATPGPWEVNDSWDAQRIVRPAFTRKGDGTPKRAKRKDTVIVGLEDDGSCGDPDCCSSPTYHVEIAPADAEYIAAANPQVVLRLLDELERAEARVKRVIESLVGSLHAPSEGEPCDCHDCRYIGRVLAACAEDPSR